MGDLGMKCPFCSENLIEGDLRCPNCRGLAIDFDYFENMDKMEKSIPMSLFWTYLVKN